MENKNACNRNGVGNAIRGLSALALTAVMLCLSGIATAELGGAVSSVQSDREYFQGTNQVTHAGSYDIHEIKTAAGSSIREYVSPEGKVFAVAWSSAGHP